MPDINDDPFAGADEARETLAAASQRLRDYHTLNEEQTQAALVIINAAAAEIASGADKAEKIMTLVDKVAGVIANPKTLLTLFGIA